MNRGGASAKSLAGTGRESADGWRERPKKEEKSGFSEKKRKTSLQ